jgi:RTX calcium-binding nonapeptide repeat (4 copies)
MSRVIGGIAQAWRQGVRDGSGAGELELHLGGLVSRASQVDGRVVKPLAPLAVLLVACAVASVGTARAATVDHEPTSDTITYSADTGELNDLSVDENGVSFTFFEGGDATITALGDCGPSVPPAPPPASCPVDTVTHLMVDLGDEDDQVTIFRVAIAATLDGGLGSDTFIDQGTPGPTTFDGGRTTPARTRWSTRAARRWRGSIGDGANDGAPGEHDDIQGDIEDVAGGAAADTLTGDDADNVLVGALGDDTVAGGAGDDLLTGDEQGVAVGGNDSLDGGQGNDEFDGGPGDDTLHGGPGDDLLDPGSVPPAEITSDLLDGGPGRDDFVARPGSVVEAQDGEVDSIECPSGGPVTLNVDPIDVVSPFCPRTPILPLQPPTARPSSPSRADVTPLALLVKAPRRIALSVFLKHGLKVTYTCSEACALVSRVTVDRRTARRLHLASPIVARRAGNIAHLGRTNLTLRPNAAIKRRLRAGHPRRLVLTLLTTATDRAGNVGRRRTKVLVTR